MKVIAIIQARMGSTRLPGKMTMDLSGKPVIAHVIERAQMVTHIHEVWLATTIARSDDVLANWAKEHQVKYCRGSEYDVLDRYYQTAIGARANVVVRVTGDCPLLDPVVIDQVVKAHLEGGAEYTSNIHPPTFPDGLDTEVFSFATLEKIWKEAVLRSEREHVTPYLWKNPELFPQRNIVHTPDLSAERWTLDTPEDLEFLRRVVAACNVRGGFCGMEEILEILHMHPEWRQINQMYERNEGYQKSVMEDTLQS